VKLVKIKEGFIVRKIADTNIVVPIGDNIADFNGFISLNETALFLWKKIAGGTDLSQLANDMTQEYEISMETAQKDIKRFLERLKRADMLDEYA
jgi:hypothetical protein